LALLVELGELANETRTFKFWSTKGPSPKARILDEYADGLHFLLSLGLALNTSQKVFTYFAYKKKSLTEQFLCCYQDFSCLATRLNLKNYQSAMKRYLSLTVALGLTPDEVIDAYRAKLAVNYKRQDEKY
jgi:dimeric dUTPase (all-alpha-NTP-PPase superfamily)